MDRIQITGMHMSFRLLFFVGLLCTVMTARADLPLRVIHPDRPSANDARYDYQIKLLRLALDKSGISYEMRPSLVKMEQGRSLLQLEQDRDIDVVWSMTSREREQKLLPVRIPIDKGLIGYRVFLVRKDRLDDFRRVRTIADLQHLQAGQVTHWPDTAILRGNGLDVYGAAAYESLFKMLEAGRFDYFPRSVTEVWDEIAAHPGQGFVVEQTLLMVYPAAAYYFVNRNNKPLADAIETGLRRAMRDGSFDRLFDSYYGKYVRKGNLAARKVIFLTNPLLPEETPLTQRHLWFDPAHRPAPAASLPGLLQ